MEDDGELINPEDIVEVYEINPEDLDGEDMDDDDDAGAGQEGEEEEVEEEEESEILDRGDNSSGVFTEHTDSIFCVALDPTDSVAITGSQDDRALVWRVGDRQRMFECTDFKDSVTYVAFNFDGTMLATGSLDGVIIVWSCADSTLLNRFECGDDVAFMEWHPTANFLLAGTGSGCAHMWDVPRGNMTFFTPHAAAVTGGKWMPDGRTFATVSEDGSFVVTSPKTRETLLKLDSSTHQFHDAPLTALAIHADSTRAAVGAQDGVVRLVQVKTGRILGAFEGHTDSVEMIAFSSGPGHAFFASASLDHTIRVVDLTTLLPLATCTYDAGVAGVRFHLTQPLIYGWSLDGTTRVWDARNGAQLKMLTGHRDHVLDCAVSKDGNTVVTCSEDGTARVYLNVLA